MVDVDNHKWFILTSQVYIHKSFCILMLPLVYWCSTHLRLVNSHSVKPTGLLLRLMNPLLRREFMENSSEPLDLDAWASHRPQVRSTCMPVNHMFSLIDSIAYIKYIYPPGRVDGHRFLRTCLLQLSVSYSLHAYHCHKDFRPCISWRTYEHEHHQAG